MNITAAGRIAVIESLLNTEITDDSGNIIGYADPLISVEEALSLLKLEPLLPETLGPDEDC